MFYTHVNVYEPTQALSAAHILAAAPPAEYCQKEVDPELLNIQQLTRDIEVRFSFKQL